MSEPSPPSVAAFWDLNPHLSEDPTFWMAHPLCREAVNSRVSGDSGTWPLDFLYSRAGSPRFDRMLSLGCGTGRVERAIRRLGISEHVEGIDASAVSIRIARQKALEEGLDQIDYSIADLDVLSLRGRSFGAIVFHESLHHVRAVEHLMAEVRRALLPGGLLFLEEWTGPSRTEWTEDRLSPLRALFSEVPLKWRKWPDLRAPIEHDDPTEAVRSSAIRPTVRRLFHVIEDRPLGGQIVSVLLPQIQRTDMTESEVDGLVSRWLSLEALDLASNPDSSFYNAILASPRAGFGSIGALMRNSVRAFAASANRRHAIEPSAGS